MICCCYWYLNLGGFLICGIKKVIFFVIWFFLCSRDNYLFVVSFVKLRHDSCSIPSPAKIPAHQLPHTPPSVSLLVHCSYFQNYPLPVFLLFLCLPCSFQKQSVLRLILLTDQKNYNQCKTFLIKKKKRKWQKSVEATMYILILFMWSPSPKSLIFIAQMIGG